MALFVEFSRLEIEEMTMHDPPNHLKLVTRSSGMPGKKYYTEAFRNKIHEKFGIRMSVLKGPYSTTRNVSCVGTKNIYLKHKKSFRPKVWRKKVLGHQVVT